MEQNIYSKVAKAEERKIEYFRELNNISKILISISLGLFGFFISLWGPSLKYLSSCGNQKWWLLGIGVVLLLTPLIGIAEIFISLKKNKNEVSYLYIQGVKDGLEQLKEIQKEKGQKNIDILKNQIAFQRIENKIDDRISRLNKLCEVLVLLEVVFIFLAFILLISFFIVFPWSIP